MFLATALVFVASSAWTLLIAIQSPDSARIKVVSDPLLFLSLGLWFGAGLAGHIGLQRMRPDRDAVLFPTVMILCGWGILTIWRLQGSYALRQAVWLCIGTTTMLLTVRWFHFLRALRDYPYVALLFGAMLTAMTLVFGVNPSENGPRLWLGFGDISWLGAGVFLQPSELLKPLLVIFLAAYLSRRHALLQLQITGFTWRLPTAFLAPMLVMWGLSMFMVIVQRDLGAGWVLYWGFLCIFFFATGRRRYVALGFVLFVVGAMVAYYASELVRFRVHGWLYPWSQTNGEYYQIVRALDAVRTGGMVGAGFGRGTPYEIPLSHSDFIFPAIANEWGKYGAAGLLVLTIIIVQRIAMIGFSRRRGSYTQLLMYGVAVFIAVQAFVNITGVLRLLPLTGVPLPLVSYGGSAMVVLFFGMGLVYGGDVKA